MSGLIRGATILELMIVIAILGVLFSLSSWILPRDRFQVNQAVEQLSRTVERARFMAVERNEFVWVEFDATAQSVKLRGQPSASDDSASETLRTIDFDAGDFEGLEYSLDVSSPAELLFDARGVGHGILANDTYLSGGVFTLTVRHEGSGFSRNVSVNQYGRIDAP